jgi:hypothetical protein
VTKKNWSPRNAAKLLLLPLIRLYIIIDRRMLQELPNTETKTENLSVPLEPELSYKFFSSMFPPSPPPTPPDNEEHAGEEIE